MYDKTEPYYGKIDSSSRITIEGKLIRKKISSLGELPPSLYCNYIIKNAVNMYCNRKIVSIYNLYVCIYKITRIKSLSFAARNFTNY